jgi:IS1 family transposase
VLALYGDAWVWIAFAPAWRLVAAFVVGKRDQESANVLLQRLQAVSCGCIPFFTTGFSDLCVWLVFMRLSRLPLMKVLHTQEVMNTHPAL